jgi:hypothetical protein
MKSSLVKFALFSLFIATPALADEPVTLVRDGVTYIYSVETKGDVKILTGRVVGGEPFRLRVVKGWVGGTVGARTVSFAVREVVRSKPVETAERISTR